MIDNGLGVGAGIASDAEDEHRHMEARIIDSKIYGESPAHDCP